MNIEFDESYFEGGDHPAGYSSYGGLLPEYSDSLMEVLHREGVHPDSIMVVGCAYGQTVAGLRESGIDAAGVDVSDWALSVASDEYGDFFYKADVTSRDEMADVTGTFGSPDVAYTECVLECLDGDSAVEACEILRSASSVVVHQVYTTVSGDYYNNKTMAEWKSLCDPSGDDIWKTNQEMVA